MSDSKDQLLRIEVLENELKHERDAKETAIAISQQILQSLSNVLNKLRNAKASGNASSEVSGVLTTLDVGALREFIESLTDENTTLKSPPQGDGEGAVKGTRGGGSTSSQHSSSGKQPNGSQNAGAEDLGTPSDSVGGSIFELNSDLHEIDLVDLENLLLSNDDGETQATRAPTIQNERLHITPVNMLEGVLSDASDIDDVRSS
jgi:hypothetical protein